MSKFLRRTFAIMNITSALALPWPVLAKVSSPDKLHVSLIWINNLGTPAQAALHIRKNKIWMDAREIDGTLYPVALPIIQSVSRTQSLPGNKRAGCSMGTYTLSVQKLSTPKQSEKGCIESPRFQVLRAQFQKLAGLAGLK